MTDPLFSSTQGFETAFHARLLELLALPPDRDALGLFILVLANASLLPRLARQLSGDLAQRHHQLSALTANAEDHYPADDLAVFRALQSFDLSRVPVAEQRRAGPWQLQFNPLRSLRPARNSNAVIRSLQQPFNPQAFHFDKPFLEREILWRGDIGGQELRLLFNKFPFARYHCLAVIDAAAHRPQFLHSAHLEQLLQVMAAFASLEGLAFAWNSLGAQASVNHQHWQMTLTDGPLPIEDNGWRHNGGNQNYPLPVESFDRPEALWQAIDRCQRYDQAFNLFLRPDRYWLIHRRLQGDYPTPAWSGGLAWSEVCGVFNLGDESVFRALNAQAVTQQLSVLAPD